MDFHQGASELGLSLAMANYEAQRVQRLVAASAEVPRCNGARLKTLEVRSIFQGKTMGKIYGKPLENLWKIYGSSQHFSISISYRFSIDSPKIP